MSDEIRAEIKTAAKALCHYPSGPHAANSCCSGIGRCEMKSAIAEITRLRAELATARCNDMGDAWITQKHAWQEAIEDALLQWCDAPSEDEAPKDALRRLIQYEITAALDPAVSQAAADMVATARRDGMEECAKWHDAVATEYEREQAIYEAKDSWMVAYVFAHGAAINKNRAAAIRAAAGEGK